MAYDKMTTSKLSVAAPNVLNLSPGGYYNLQENNRTEAAVVKLHILQKHIEMAIESYCDSSENTIRLGDKIDKLADELFEQYETYIEEGVDPFKFHDYELERTNLGDAYIMTQVGLLDTDRSDDKEMTEDEYDYRTSEEACREEIEANDYEFDEKGGLV